MRWPSSKSHAIRRHLKFSKKGTFERQKYFRMEIRNLEPRLVRKQDVAKEGGLEPKVNVKVFEETNVTQTSRRQESEVGAHSYRKLWVIV